VTPAEIERICAKTGFSRFPIIEQDGRFSGYLHIRDVIDIPAEQRDQPVPAQKIRPLPTVVPETDLRTALDRMRRIGAHLAEVADAVDVGEGADQSNGGHPAADAPDRAQIEGDIAEITPAALQPMPTLPTALPAKAAPTARGVVMLEDVIEALIGEIRDATRRSPDRAVPPSASSGA
jgi:CBS domain containing-hemolysin-like protein